MKVLKSLSILSAVVLSACGSSQNATNTTPNNVYGQNYGQTGYGNSGLGSGTQTALYGTNGQIIGYKVRTPIMGGTYNNIPAANASFAQSVQVNAGDRLFINLAGATYRVSQAYCNGSFMNMLTTGNTSFPINNMSITLNGQQIGGGYGGAVTVQASGTLTINAVLNPVNVSCGFLYGNRSAQVVSYMVSLGGGGYQSGYYNTGYYGSSAAVELERCTNTSGANMTCPY